MIITHTSFKCNFFGVYDLKFPRIYDFLVKFAELSINGKVSPHLLEYFPDKLWNEIIFNSPMFIWGNLISEFFWVVLFKSIIGLNEYLHFWQESPQVTPLYYKYGTFRLHKMVGFCSLDK